MSEGGGVDQSCRNCLSLIRFRAVYRLGSGSIRFPGETPGAPGGFAEAFFQPVVHRWRYGRKIHADFEA
jgi:hypothetical protein